MNSPTVLALRRGLVYEGDGAYFRAIHPIPVLTRAVCEWLPDEVTTVSQLPALLFREDSFDPVTRVRRGRLYQRDGQQGGRSFSLDNVHNYPFGPHVGISAGLWEPDGWYNAYRVGLAPKNWWTVGSNMVLGERGYETLWRVADAEQVSSGDVLLTLRAISSLGALPTLRVPIRDYSGAEIDPKPVLGALDQIVDALHVQQPQPIVDVCRESARVILAAWLGPPAQAKDLGDVIKAIPVDYTFVGNAAHIINRLHPRGKSAERERQSKDGKTLRGIVDEDAQTSVQLIGLILRDIGWAAS